ncbi:MAG: hypothetical protein ACE5H3_02695 [Planctomycetota bacterium]
MRRWIGRMPPFLGKKTFPALGGFFWMLAGPLGAQTGGIECPNTEAFISVPPKLEPSGFAACDNGIVDFRFGGVHIKWEDPVCPLALIWSPPQYSFRDRKGATWIYLEAAHPQELKFECNEDDNCVQIGIQELPGVFPQYATFPCHEDWTPPGGGPNPGGGGNPPGGGGGPPGKKQ